MGDTTLILDIFGMVGILATIMGGLVVIKASREAKTAEVWKAEAEAQKARADRLQGDLTEIKERLKRIEEENTRLVELLSNLDPQKLFAMKRGL
ncbi:hypothetical protein ACN20G_23395 [Streptomyces sp. BI20]|uniref:hypothetical protein n=1 Tax=Streptomyces sp. BI20 TaxID=3403460 RepID=UPI003C74CA1B